MGRLSGTRNALYVSHRPRYCRRSGTHADATRVAFTIHTPNTPIPYWSFSATMRAVAAHLSSRHPLGQSPPFGQTYGAVYSRCRRQAVEQRSARSSVQHCARQAVAFASSATVTDVAAIAHDFTPQERAVSVQPSDGVEQRRGRRFVRPVALSFER